MLLPPDGLTLPRDDRCSLREYAWACRPIRVSLIPVGKASCQIDRRMHHPDTDQLWTIALCLHIHLTSHVTSTTNVHLFTHRCCPLRYVRVFAIHLSYVMFVRPTKGVKTFGNISSPFCTLAMLWPPCKILRRSSQENSSVGGVKRKRGSKIERCHVRVSHLPMSFLLFLASYTIIN